MTRQQRVKLEGFLVGLGTGTSICDYKRDTKSYNLWWKGYSLAKNHYKRQALIDFIIETFSL